MQTILLADDSATIRRAVEIAFHQELYAGEPFALIHVKSGAEALARARELHPSLVLADHSMPDQDGYALASALRDDPSTAAIPILMLSSKASAYDEARGHSAGIAGHVVKPFDCQSLEIGRAHV